MFDAVSFVLDLEDFVLVMQEARLQLKLIVVFD